MGHKDQTSMQKRTPEVIAMQRAQARAWRQARRVPVDASIMGEVIEATRVRRVPETGDLDPKQSPLDRVNHRGDVWYVNEAGRIVYSRWDS